MTSLLKFVGLDIKDVDNHLSVYSKDSKAESNDDIYFLPELDDNSQVGYSSNFFVIFAVSLLDCFQ